MLRRYAPVCLLIMAVSTGTAALAYKASVDPQFTAFCNFQAFVRAVQVAQPQPNPEFLKFTASLAAAEVQAASPVVYQAVAKSQHTTAGALGAKAFTAQAPGVGAFRVSVIDSEPKRAVQSANAVCQQFVTVIKKQRVDEINGDVKIVQDRIAGIQADIRKLQKIPAKRRTPADVANLSFNRVALTRNANLIAAMVSLPPDHISVLRNASFAQKSQTVSLKKYLIIALMAGLLACFLVILVGEVVAESRRGSDGSRRVAS
jgi:hypothetical protein